MAAYHLWRIRRHGRLEAGDWLSVARDEELGEVPLNLATDVGRRREVLVERRLIVALYRDLRHHRKLTWNLELQNSLIVALLPDSWLAKLLAGTPTITRPLSLYFS